MHIATPRSRWALATIAGAAALCAGAAASAGATAGAATPRAGSSARAAARPHASATPTLTFALSIAPQSLDPGLDYSTQGFEFNWLVYTGLTTYAHKAGTAAKLIPGLGTTMPKITHGGRTYTITLRKGLRFSNGAPVLASDFTTTVERAIRIPWGGAGEFLTPVIKGAQAFGNHKAKTVSGISTNNRARKIVIHLTKPYGPFENVLAFPALGLVPASAPMKVSPTSPPPGVGPYMVKNVSPNQSFSFLKNPVYDAHPIPGVPTGQVNYSVKINPNVEADALSVLNNTADVFDYTDAIPGSLLAQIHAKAADRFSMVDMGASTYYVFLNASKPPFSSQDARAAVATGLSEPAMNDLGSGTLEPGCFFLSPDVPGHPASTTKCPYGSPTADGNIARARKLVQASRQANVPITVYSEETSPYSEWMQYYANLLTKIGFKHVTIKDVADANYLTILGQSKKLDPQTGFNDWFMDFANPVDFYGTLLAGNAIAPTNNLNFSMANDPVINRAVAKLGPVPTPQLAKVAAQWQKVERYEAKKAYVVVFGYGRDPFFTSARVKRTPAMVNINIGWDLSELGVK